MVYLCNYCKSKNKLSIIKVLFGNSLFNGQNINRLWAYKSLAIIELLLFKSTMPILTEFKTNKKDRHIFPIYKLILNTNYIIKYNSTF
jgi:hypothetical protein